MLSRVKILGVWFSRNRGPQEHYDWNFQPQINKMKGGCAWNNQALSLEGKLTVYNCLIKMVGGNDIEFLLGAKQEPFKKCLILSPFNAEVVRSWNAIHDTPPRDEEGVRVYTIS